MAILTAAALGLALAKPRLLQSTPAPVVVNATPAPTAAPAPTATPTTSPTPSPEAQRVAEARAVVHGLSRELRVVPHSVDREVVGYKIFKIRRDGNVARWGFRDNDVIVAISGTSLGGTFDLETLLEREMDAESWTVDILRGGKPLRLEIERQPLKPAPPRRPTTARRRR